MYREGLKMGRLFFGLFLYALGIVLTIHANIGVGPWDVFHQGVSLHTGLTMGTTSILTAFVLIVVAAVMQEQIGFGTLCNMVAIGAFMDFLMLGGLVPVMENMASGVLMLTAGLFVIAFASYFYIGAGYGAGPRDSLMVILAKRTGKSVGLCRCFLEGSVFLTGWLLGGKTGWGTLLTVGGIGCAVQLVFGFLRFDVKAMRQESFYETWTRLKRAH